MNLIVLTPEPAQYFRVMAMKGQFCASHPRVNPEKRGMQRWQGVNKDPAYLGNSRVWPDDEASNAP